MSIHSKQISRLLQNWFKVHRRHLPWRETTDPYLIWISEIILQQTRVAQGYSYYCRFVEAFPSVDALANAPLEQVLKLWEGLGYYSRARNLHKAAQQIVHSYDGVIPNDHKQVLALPGIGPYTAAAILSFAYNSPYPTVDGNVLRVLSRLAASELEIDTTEGRKFYNRLAFDLMDPQQPSLHNNAMMELGALICLPANPKCVDCPIEKFCASAHSSWATRLPIKKGKVPVVERAINYFMIYSDGKLLLHQRLEGDIWAGLFDLPDLSELPVELQQLEEGESTTISWPSSALSSSSFSAFSQISSPHISLFASTKHRLTHRLLHLKFFLWEVSPADLCSFQSVGRIVELCSEDPFPPMPIMTKKVVNDFTYRILNMKKL